jgi:hypothetical protein
MGSRKRGLRMIERAFEQAFRGYGVPHRVSNASSIEAAGLKLLLDFLRFALQAQRKAVGPMGPAYFDIIENPAFNALATTHHGYELITIYLGAADYIFKLFFCFLSDAATLSSIGNADAESLPAEAIEALRGAAAYQPRMYLPKDEQRVMAARSLALLTCAFILLHEVGHIVRCHPAFLRRKYGAAAYEELPAIGWGTTHDRNIRLAFEWEADEYAAATSYQLWRTLQGADLFLGVKGIDADVVWSIAASMTFMIIAHLSGGDMIGDSATHPAPIFRYTWSFLSVTAAPECKSFSPDPESFNKGLQETLSWFARNKLGINLGGIGKEDVDNLAEKMKWEHDAVRESLREEFPLLERLNTERLAGADSWRARSRK